MYEIDNNEFYEESFNKYGISAKGVHWDSKETQYLRFKILTSLIKDDINNSSIIDVGCGYAEYLIFLNKINLTPDIYLGIDCERLMIDICTKRFEKNTFLKCNILTDEIPRADYLICSGTLNILKQNDFLNAIKNCIKACNKGFVFNFLTENNLHNLTFEEIYKFCKDISSEIQVNNKYLNNDCTILLKK